MPYKVELSRNAKVNGNRYKAGASVPNLSDDLFEELKERDLVAAFEETKDINLPVYEKITVAQIEERLTELNVNHENITDKKELYTLLEASLKVGE